LPDIRKLMPQGVDIKAIFDQSVFVKASLRQRSDGRGDGGRADRDDDPARMFFLVSRAAAMDAL
jgi:hypothetical protein